MQSKKFPASKSIMQRYIVRSLLIFVTTSVLFFLLVIYFRAVSLVEGQAEQARLLINDKYLNAAFSMYTVDLQQIDFIVESLSSHKQLSQIEVRDVTGKVISEREPTLSAEVLTIPPWFENLLFTESERTLSVKLHYTETYQDQPNDLFVGTIITKLRPAITFDQLLEIMIPTFAFILLQLSALTIMLIRLFKREIGEPLGKVTREIKHSWPVDLGNHELIKIPEEQTKNEIGQIVRAYNRAQNASIKYFALLKKASNEATTLSKTDVLTGALNRRGILEKTAHYCSSTPPFLFAVIDIDSMGQFNDSFGYPSGDAMLIAYYSRIKELVPKQASIGRISGGTFILAMPLENMDYDIVDEFQQLLSFQDVDITSQIKYTITASIGVYLRSLVHSPSNLNEQKLLHYGHIALQKAKESGRQNIKLFDINMEKQNIEQQKDRTQLLELLNSANFTMAYQPKVDLVTKKIIGCEALLRLPDEPNKAPFHLITLAEKNGQIINLGNMIFERVIDEVSSLRDSVSENFSVSINVSPKQLASAEFLNLLEELNHTKSFRLNQVDIEITESSQLGDIASFSGSLNRCRELGCSVTLDDFGTGFASMESLLKTGFKQIKIDREFVKRICSDADFQNIVASIVYLANLLEMDVIAEGIENQDQETWLRDHGINIGQGFLYSRPIPFADFVDLLHQDTWSFISNKQSNRG